MPTVVAMNETFDEEHHHRDIHAGKDDPDRMRWAAIHLTNRGGSGGWFQSYFDDSWPPP